MVFWKENSDYPNNFSGKGKEKKSMVAWGPKQTSISSIWEFWSMKLHMK